MKIKIQHYLITVKRESCPLPDSLKLGKEVGWSDSSKIRCVGCTYYFGLTYGEDNRPLDVVCGYK